MATKPPPGTEWLCHTCGHSVADRVYGFICRRNPPIPVYDETRQQTYSVWPKVASDDYCGEFKPAEGMPAPSNGGDE